MFKNSVLYFEIRLFQALYWKHYLAVLAIISDLRSLLHISSNVQLFPLFRYAYYGNGDISPTISDKGKFDCGLSIKQITKEDYGSWKCLVTISFEEKSKIIGKILKVTPSTGRSIESYNLEPKTTSSDVYVKVGSSYKVISEVIVIEMNKA